MERPPMETDPEYKKQGGWKIHLTIGPASYEQKAAEVKDWLQNNFRISWNWKHLCGGDKHEKDFTIYLGSFPTMMDFVQRLNQDPVILQVDASNAGAVSQVVYPGVAAVRPAPSTLSIQIPAWTVSVPAPPPPFRGPRTS